MDTRRVFCLLRSAAPSERSGNTALHQMQPGRPPDGLLLVSNKEQVAVGLKICAVRGGRGILSGEGYGIGSRG